MRYYDDELASYEVELLASAGVHAIGRQAYEDMAPHWQASTEPFAKPMNEIPKAVFSRTLTTATWPESTIHRDIETDMAQLKQRDGPLILAHGGAGFAQALTRLGLVDEYRLNVHPVALHDDHRLFGAPTELRLVQALTFPRGTLACTYVPS